MIDYLLRFTDESSAWTQLSAYTLPENALGPAVWDMTCVMPDVCVFRITGTELIDDGEGGAYEREIRNPLPGWYIWVARPERDPALEGETCVLIASAETGKILHTITTLEDLETLGIAPMFAGRPYVIGSPIIATD